MSDESIVIEMDNCWIELQYYFTSDLTFTIGIQEEIEQCPAAMRTIEIRDNFVDYYCEEFGAGVKKELIEGSKIKSIEIERFSESFECNPCSGEMRPDRGDYFSTIRIHLDSARTLCLRGADSIFDGYIEIWCE